MPRSLFLTVTDACFFPGTLAAVNSVLTFHPSAHVAIAVKASLPLSTVQTELLKGDPRVRLLPAEQFLAPGRHLAAWELKAYAAHDLAPGHEVLVGIDSDALLCGPVDDVIDRCHQTGRFLGGQDGVGADYDERYGCYGIALPAHNPKYMSTSLYFWPVTAANQCLLNRWAECVSFSEFNGRGPFPGHGDQGVLNALLFAHGRTADIELLDNRLWSQHWTFWDTVLEFRAGRFVNRTAEGAIQRAIHLPGGEKFWNRSFRERILTTHPLQTNAYLWFLTMLWLGPLSRLDHDPFDWLPLPSWHLLADLVDFLPEILPLHPPAHARWEQVGDRMLNRLIEGIPRHMPLGGSLSDLIGLVEQRPGIRRFVEVGGYLGGSVLTLALRFLNRDIDFYSVESFRGNLDGSMDGGPLPGRRQYLENLARFPTLRVRPVPGDSRLAASMFDDRSLDFVFIDACHETEAVLADIDAWLPKLTPGGILAGDDFDWPSVRRAVDQRFAHVHSTPTGIVWWVSVTEIEMQTT